MTVAVISMSKEWHGVDSHRLDGKIAVVTGAGSGIGFAIARLFIAEGARVVLADISERRLAAASGELGDSAHPTRCDVSSSADVEAVVAAAVDTFGGLDIMVNNAATQRSAELVDLDEADWQRTLAVNLTGAFLGIKHAAPAIVARGGGAILNTSSAAGRRAVALLGAYSASKAGVEALTRSAALELRDRGVRVNAVVPGFIGTEGALRSRDVLADGVAEDLDAHVAARQSRWGRPDEVAAAALHLVSDEARFTSGLMYTVDNGYSIA